MKFLAPQISILILTNIIVDIVCFYFCFSPSDNLFSIDVFAEAHPHPAGFNCRVIIHSHGALEDPGIAGGAEGLGHSAPGDGHVIRWQGADGTHTLSGLIGHIDTKIQGYTCWLEDLTTQVKSQINCIIYITYLLVKICEFQCMENAK